MTETFTELFPISLICSEVYLFLIFIDSVELEEPELVLNTQSC